jgi:hypothetical protein
VTACTECGRASEARFRFCPWCGAAQRRKIVEFFRAHPSNSARALRVSRYYGEDPQVRFSVWDDGVAQAAVSLDEEESRRLAAFITATAPRRRRGLLDHLRVHQSTQDRRAP